MDATIRIDLDIQRQLKLKSVELGVTQKELANTYILNGLNGEKSKSNMKSIEDIAKVLNIEIENIDDVLADLDVDEYEILSEEKHLNMDEIKDIVNNNRSNEESNVNLTDMIGIVESPQKTDSLEEKMESYDRR
ncbi:MAG: hypothetical protein E7Z86_05595 [Methanosphaera stadtmanae]|jgi:DNA-directed RNA polymerase specialized sigma subunit|nr:hypothetical protein [Methanosphaera stadtmanae]